MTRASPWLLLAAVSLLSACQRGKDAQPSAPVADTSPGAEAALATDVAPATTPEPEAPKPEVPTLVVDTFDGKKFDLAKHRGKWVVVNFWATWCNPCLKEIPDLDAFDKSRKDVQVIGLAYEEIERADMQAFLKQHVISYPIAVIDVYKPPADFETPRGLPMTYLIAPDGKVAKRFLGPITSEDLSKIIDAVGTEPIPAT